MQTRRSHEKEIINLLGYYRKKKRKNERKKIKQEIIKTMINKIIIPLSKHISKIKELISFSLNNFEFNDTKFNFFWI